MSWKLLIPTFLLSVIVGCSSDSSPVTSSDDLYPEGGYYAAKPVSHGSDSAMRRFYDVADDVQDILRDIKRYIGKGRWLDRHDPKVRGLDQKMARSWSRLNSAFKNVRNVREAQEEMRALAAYKEGVVARLRDAGYAMKGGPFYVSLMVNPCALPWIREYVCGYYTF